MATLSLKVPASLRNQLAAAATKRGLSQSALIRRALERELGKPAGEHAGSFLALAKDLAGCVAGAPDLSHHPRHLRGYGR